VDSFDLGRLSDYDFEVLCKDLFEALLGIGLEVFARGPDRGIDLRHVAADGRVTVVQCKHRPRGGRAQLIKEMSVQEQPKVAALSPARYIVATSAELTVDAKEKLVNALAPHLSRSGDVYGAEQIVEELRKRPEIVERHFRLWLSSTAVLHSVLRKERLIRTHDLLTDIDTCARTFVPTPAFGHAQRMLNEKSVCIVVGNAGVGKTTIAKMLAALYAVDGYDIVEVSRDADEINAAWRDDVRQLFYYDDFLGRTALGDKLGKNEDSRLLRVIERIRRTLGKRLVLTTRGYILNHAETTYAKLGEADLSPLTSAVRPEGFRRDVRENILHNLVYFADLPVPEKRRFAEPAIWNRLVDHPHFNPRLIERTLGLTGFVGISGKDVAEELLRNFADPQRLWERVVEDELDDAAVHLLEVFHTLDLQFVFGVEEAELRQAWARYRRELGLDDDPRLFRRALRTLDGSMVVFDVERLLPAFRLHNPSIKDYLERRYTRGLVRLDALLRSFDRPVQIDTLLHMAERDGDQPSVVLAHVDAVVDAIFRIRSADHGEPGDPLVWIRMQVRLLRTASLLGSQRLADHVADEMATGVRVGVFDRAKVQDLAILAYEADRCTPFLRLRAVHFATAVLDRARAMVEEAATSRTPIDRQDLDAAMNFLQARTPHDLPPGFARILRDRASRSGIRSWHRA
jgi:energy-coupling factor transporter ATP-binding protein EcfA2